MKDSEKALVYLAIRSFKELTQLASRYNIDLSMYKYSPVDEMADVFIQAIDNIRAEEKKEAEKVTYLHMEEGYDATPFPDFPKPRRVSLPVKKPHRCWNCKAYL